MYALITYISLKTQLLLVLTPLQIIFCLSRGFPNSSGLIYEDIECLQLTRKLNIDASGDTNLVLKLQATMSWLVQRISKICYNNYNQSLSLRSLLKEKHI